MFDRKKFAEILKKISVSYGSINKMANKIGVTTSYISKLIRLYYDNPPSPEILRQIANNSNYITTYVDLMFICGYLQDCDFKKPHHLSQKYYVADLHFGHQNILEYEHRPFKTIEEMDKAYILKWNEKVQLGDCVYILGDFSFYKGKETTKILKQLNGQKYLIKGNHDERFLNDKDFDKSQFVWIKDYEFLKDDDDFIALFHYPIQAWNRQHYGALHFYGHVHSNTGTMHPAKYDIPNSYNVGVDIIQEPMTKQEILNFYNKKEE